MGNCVGAADSGAGKGIDAKGKPVQKARRRLSVSDVDRKAEDNKKSDVRTIQDVADQSSLLELFGNAKRRHSLCGAPVQGMTQKGFDNKNLAQEGDKGIDNVHPITVGFCCKKGLKPESPNQDDFFVVRADDIGVFGVFDGHGPFGHDVSNMVHNTLPRLFIQKVFKENVAPEEAFTKAFTQTQEDIVKLAPAKNVDLQLSGTTATVILYKDNKLCCAHVGDSRAVAAIPCKDGDRQFTAVDLTTDHKPNDPLEKKRIEDAGGQVKRLEGDIPFRIFLKGKLFPGLAMSRSLGDLKAVQCGVTCVPETNSYDIVDHEFFILCSDGVWEFISSQEAVDMVGKFPREQCQQAAEKLAQFAWQCWIKEEGTIVDDITVVVGYINKSKQGEPEPTE